MDNVSFLEIKHWKKILQSVGVNENVPMPPTNMGIPSEFTFDKQHFRLNLEDPFHFETGMVFCCNYKTIPVQCRRDHNDVCLEKNNEEYTSTHVIEETRKATAILKLSQLGQYMGYPFVTSRNKSQTTQTFACNLCGLSKKKVYDHEVVQHFAKKYCSFCQQRILTCSNNNCYPNFYRKSKTNNPKIKEMTSSNRFICKGCEPMDVRLVTKKCFSFDWKAFKFLKHFCNDKRRKDRLQSKKIKFLQSKKNKTGNEIEFEEFSYFVHDHCDFEVKVFYYLVLNLIENLGKKNNDETRNEIMEDFFEELEVNCVFLSIRHLIDIRSIYQFLQKYRHHTRSIKYVKRGKPCDIPDREFSLNFKKEKKQLGKIFNNTICEIIEKKKNLINNKNN